MLHLASIDAGSNAFRCEVFELSEKFLTDPVPKDILPKEINKRLKRSIRKRIPCRLGAEVFRYGHLSKTKIDEAVSAFQYFSDFMNDQCVDYYFAAATSASREATNGKEMVKEIKEKTNINVHIIDAEEETRLVDLALIPYYQLELYNHMFVDLGGGSVEVSVREKEKILFQRSFNLGSVRLISLTNGKEEKMNFIVQKELKPLKDFYTKTNFKLDYYITLGGNAVDLAKFGHNFFKINIGGGAGRNLPIDWLSRSLDILRSIPSNLRTFRFNLNPDRGDVIYQAGLVYKALGEIAGVKTMHVPPVNLNDGLLYSLVQRLRDEYTLSEESIENSALKWNAFPKKSSY